MNEKCFTSEEINEKTNLIFIEYLKHYKAGRMSFAEYTLVENVIIKVQGVFSENGDDE